MFKKFLPLAAAAAVMLTATSASAQTCSANGAASATCNVAASVSTTVQHVVRLTIPSTTIALGDVTNENQYTASGGTVAELTSATQGVTIRANRAWRLQLNATATTWTFTPAGGTTDPARAATTLLASINGGAFGAIATTATDVASGAASGSANVNVAFRTNFNIATDPPGSYSLPVQFTLIAP
ncbi:MAG: hypothetical protein SFW08_01955 [Gemmatimonadaceae bacterium]|nr:hypothetical protein [Gemmatimonadaceae bacterium]